MFASDVHMGPLFLLHINDLPSVAQSDLRLYASDTLLCATTDNGFSTLQTDVDVMQGWAEKWRMSFNTTKTHTHGTKEGCSHTQHTSS